MKRIICFAFLLAIAIGADAQDFSSGASVDNEIHLFDFPLNTRRLEAGINLGQVGSFTEYARFGIGANLLIGGVYVDFLRAEPQHKYTHILSDVKWEDTSVFCINAGYQIPILDWLRIMPLVGYAQTNEGLTDGNSLHWSVDDNTTTWYHEYRVKPGTRTHYFNYGGGISVQPLPWVSINAIATRTALYGGIALDFLSFTTRR